MTVVAVSLADNPRLQNAAIYRVEVYLRNLQHSLSVSC